MGEQEEQRRRRNVSREYKGFGQGGWAIRQVRNIETGTDKMQYNIIQYKRQMMRQRQKTTAETEIVFCSS